MMEVIIGARVVHILGFSIGMGGALALDFLALRWLTTPIGEDDLRLIAAVSRAVAFGFALLLGSGAVFLLAYAVATPAALGNPKLWAKLAVVAILALNARLVHRFVLPRVGRQLGRRLFEGVPRPERDAMLLVGAVSAVSWISATVLGTVRELNTVVPFAVLIVAYLAALSLAALSVLLAARVAPQVGPAGPGRRLSTASAADLVG